MLVAMTHKSISLMQLVRLMQNLLMIALPTSSMRRSMPLDPRIVLMHPRHLMRVTRMIGRLSHRSMRSTTMRRIAPLAHATTTPIIHLSRMMKSSLILSHDITSHRRRRRVNISARTNPVPIVNRPTHNLATTRNNDLLKTMQ
jgi:hypothetical protein